MIVDLREYQQLRAAALRLPVAEARLKLSAPRRRAPLPSTIERDPEVAGFLREHFARASTIEAAHAACLERFGVDRTPHRNRVARFRTKLRAGVSGKEPTS